MFSCKWLYFMAMFNVVFTKPCKEGFQSDFNNFLNSITEEGECWDMQEEEQTLGFSKLMGDGRDRNVGTQKREDNSQPPSCSYDNEFLRFVCNAVPHPAVYWTAGVVAAGGALAYNWSHIVNAMTNNMIANNRFRIVWNAAPGDIPLEPVKRGLKEPQAFSVSSQINSGATKRSSTTYHYNQTSDYYFSDDNTINPTGHHYSFPENGDVNKRQLNRGSGYTLVVGTGILNWEGGVSRDCLYDTLDKFLYPVVHGEERIRGCGQVYWGGDEGITRIPIQWSLWTVENDNDSYGTGLWGECCGVDPGQPLQSVDG